MDWLMAIGNLTADTPIERVLFPPRDNTEAPEKFVSDLKQTENSKEIPCQQEMVVSIAVKPAVTVESLQGTATAVPPTPEETTQGLKRRLGKKLYRARLDISNKLRIAGKPGDCLDAKHTPGLEAVAVCAMLSTSSGVK